MDTSNSSENAMVADLKLGIQSLTTLMLGYQQADDLYKWGRIEGDSESVSALKRVIPVKQTFLLDFSDKGPFRSSYASFFRNITCVIIIIFKTLSVIGKSFFMVLYKT